MKLIEVEIQSYQLKNKHTRHFRSTNRGTTPMTILHIQFFAVGNQTQTEEKFLFVIIMMSEDETLQFQKRNSYR